jgi:hypothetical protein
MARGRIEVLVFAGAASLPPGFFSTIHDYPVLFALAAAGAISVAVFVVWGSLACVRGYL